jgi:hypothetical protein
MGKTVTAGFGDEPKSARYASAPNDHPGREALPLRSRWGANVCAKVAESLTTIAEPGLTQPS